MTDLLVCWAGQTVRFDATFTDPDTGALVDTTPVVMTLEDPDGIVTMYTLGTDAALQRVSLGLYRLTVTLAVAGTWSVRATGGSTIVAVIESQVVVRASALG
jgi:uncharacterized lipoprotein NlpE involved in copper resistance